MLTDCVPPFVQFVVEGATDCVESMAWKAVMAVRDKATTVAAVPRLLLCTA
jgi:hypothetical protein